MSNTTKKRALNNRSAKSRQRRKVKYTAGITGLGGVNGGNSQKNKGIEGIEGGVQQNKPSPIDEDKMHFEWHTNFEDKDTGEHFASGYAAEIIGPGGFVGYKALDVHRREKQEAQNKKTQKAAEAAQKQEKKEPSKEDNLRRNYETIIPIGEGMINAYSRLTEHITKNGSTKGFEAQDAYERQAVADVQNFKSPQDAVAWLKEERKKTQGTLDSVKRQLAALDEKPEEKPAPAPQAEKKPEEKAATEKKPESFKGPYAIDVSKIPSKKDEAGRQRFSELLIKNPHGIVLKDDGRKTGPGYVRSIRLDKERGLISIKASESFDPDDKHILKTSNRANGKVDWGIAMNRGKWNKQTREWEFPIEKIEGLRDSFFSDVAWALDPKSIETAVKEAQTKKGPEAEPKLQEPSILEESQKKPEDAVEKKEPPKPVEKPTLKEKTIKERKPIAPWKARTDAPTPEQAARMKHVKNILGKEWAKVWRRVADLKEAGKTKEARRVLLTAGNRYFNYAKEAYERWGDGEALSKFGEASVAAEAAKTGENVAEIFRTRTNELLNEWLKKSTPDQLRASAKNREKKAVDRLAQEAAAKETPVEEKAPEVPAPDFNELDKQYDGLLMSGALTENEADELAEVYDRAKRTQDPDDIKNLADKIADIDAKNNPPVFGEEEQIESDIQDYSDSLDGAYAAESEKNAKWLDDRLNNISVARDVPVLDKTWNLSSEELAKQFPGVNPAVFNEKNLRTLSSLIASIDSPTVSNWIESGGAITGSLIAGLLTNEALQRLSFLDSDRKRINKTYKKLFEKDRTLKSDFSKEDFSDPYSSLNKLISEARTREQVYKDNRDELKRILESELESKIEEGAPGEQEPTQSEFSELESRATAITDVNELAGKKSLLGVDDYQPGYLQRAYENAVPESLRDDPEIKEAFKKAAEADAAALERHADIRRSGDSESWGAFNAEDDYSMPEEKQAVEAFKNLVAEKQEDAPVVEEEPTAQEDFSDLNISSNDAGYDAGNQQFSVDAPNADTFEKNVLADEAAPDAPVVDMPTAPAAAPQGQRTDSVPIGDLKLDPERFQFKHDSKNARGYNASKYQGAIFNPDLAGAILVWRDPEDGNLYVVNGHHRYNLALENGYTGNIDVKYSPATTAKGAKQQGALQNIADNKGTGTDVAALIRDGFSKEDMLAQGVSPGNASFNKGVTLSKLAPRLFKELEGGQNLDEDTALIIAETLPDNEDKQVEFYEHYLRKIYENGETPKKDYVESLALSYSMAEGESKGTNLFGEEDINYHEEVEARAKILQKILAELRKDERTFGRINKKNAELLAERNVLDGSLDSDAAKGIKETAKKTIGTIKEEAKFRGPLNDLLKESVRKWLDAGTDKERDAIIEDAVAKLKEYAAGLGRFGVYGDGGGRHPEQSGNLEGDTVHSDGELVQGDAPRLREESEEEGRLPDVPAGNGAGVSGVEEEVDAAGGLLAGGDTAGDEDGSGTGSGSEEEAVDAPVIEPEASAEPEPEPESAPTPAVEETAQEESDSDVTEPAPQEAPAPVESNDAPIVEESAKEETPAPAPTSKENTHPSPTIQSSRYYDAAVEWIKNIWNSNKDAGDALIDYVHENRDKDALEWHDGLREIADKYGVEFSDELDRIHGGNVDAPVVPVVGEPNSVVGAVVGENAETPEFISEEDYRKLSVEGRRNVVRQALEKALAAKGATDDPDGFNLKNSRRRIEELLDTLKKGDAYNSEGSSKVLHRHAKEALDNYFKALNTPRENKPERWYLSPSSNRFTYLGKLMSAFDNDSKRKKTLPKGVPDDLEKVLRKIPRSALNSCAKEAKDFIESSIAKYLPDFTQEDIWDNFKHFYEELNGPKNGGYSDYHDNDIRRIITETAIARNTIEELARERGTAPEYFTFNENGDIVEDDDTGAQETPEITAETPEEPSAEAAPDAPENPTVKKWDFKGWHSPNGTATFNNGRFAIKFDGFPIKETRDALKRAGFKWDKESKEWYFDGTNWKGEDILPYPEDGDTREQNILKWAAREMYNSNLFDSDDIYRAAFGKLPHGEDESTEETDETPDAPVITSEPEQSAATSDETPQEAPQEPQGAPAAEETEQEPESAAARDEKAIRRDYNERKRRVKKVASGVVSSHEGGDVRIHTDNSRRHYNSGGATRIANWKNCIDNNLGLFREAVEALGVKGVSHDDEFSDDVKQAFAKYLNELKQFSLNPRDDRRRRTEAAFADFGKKLIDFRQEEQVAWNRSKNQEIENLEIPENFTNAADALKHLKETINEDVDLGIGRTKTSQYSFLGSMAGVNLYYGYVEGNEESEKLFVDTTNHLLEAARLAKQYGLEDERVKKEKQAAFESLKKNLEIVKAEDDKQQEAAALEEKRQYEALTARKTPEDVAKKNPIGAKLGQMLRDHLYEMFGEDKIANNPTESVGRNRSIHGAFEDIRGIENADSPFESKRLFNYFINYNFPYGHDELKASIPSAEYEPDDITPQSRLLRVALNRALNPNKTGYRKTMPASPSEAEKYFYLAQDEAVRKAWSDAVNLYEKRERFDNSHSRNGYWAAKEWLTGLSDEEKKERRKLTGDATRAVTKLATLLQDALKKEDAGNYEDGVSNPFNFEAAAQAEKENSNPEDAPVLEEQAETVEEEPETGTPEEPEPPVVSEEVAETEETPTGEETETVEADAPVVNPEPQAEASAPEPVEEPKPEKPKKQRKAKGAISDEDAEDLNRRFQEATSKYKEGWQTDFNVAHENYDTTTWDVTTRELIAAPDEDRDAFRKEALKDPVIQSAFLEMLDAPMDVVKEDLLDEGREQRDLEAVRKFQDVVQRRFQQWYKDRSCIKKRKPLPGQKSIDVYRQATTDAPVIDEPAPAEEGKKKEPELAEPEPEQASNAAPVEDDAPVIDKPAPESDDEYDEDDEEYDERYEGAPDWLVKEHKEALKRLKDSYLEFRMQLNDWRKLIDPRAALDVDIALDNSDFKQVGRKIKRIAKKYGEQLGDNFEAAIDALIGDADALYNINADLKEARKGYPDGLYEESIELSDDNTPVPISKEERDEATRATLEQIETPLTREQEAQYNLTKALNKWAAENPDHPVLKDLAEKAQLYGNVGWSDVDIDSQYTGVPVSDDVKKALENAGYAIPKEPEPEPKPEPKSVEEPKQAPDAAPVEVDTATKKRMYKHMLDVGAITQDEYDKRMRELESAPVVSNEPSKTQPEETVEQRSAKQDYGKAFSEWYRKAVRVPGFVEATLGQTEPGAIFDIAERFNIPTDKIRAAQQRLLAAYGAESPAQSEPAKPEPQPEPEPAPQPEPVKEPEPVSEDAPVIDEDGVWESDEVKAAREAYEKIRDESRDLIKAGLQRWLTPYKTRRTFVADIMNAAKNGGSYPEFREIALRHGIPLDSELEEIQERVDRARDAYEESEMSIQLKDDDRARQEEIRRRKEANGEKRYRYARRSEDIYSVDAPVLTF